MSFFCCKFIVNRGVSVLDKGLSNGISAVSKGYFNMPFYEKKCREAGIELNNIKSEEDFLKIPFTYKDDLRKTSPFERTLTDKRHIFGLYSSNGTTGKKTFYVYNYADREKQAKFVREYFSSIGMKKGGLGAVIAPIGSQVMGHCMMWQFEIMQMGMTICSDLTPESLLEIIESLPVTDIATLPRMASSFSENTEWSEAAKKSSVERFVLGGDFLSDARRKLIEETWNARAYNSYGMSEVFGPLANECIYQDGLHYIDEDILIEIIDPETFQPVKVGEPGIAVFTTLWEKGFPLLRYWSGELFRKYTQPCPCGCNLPRLEHIGRACDCVMINKKYISPKQFENVVLSAGIKNARVVLENDFIELQYDKMGPAPDNDVQEQLKALFEMTSLVCRPLDHAGLGLESLKPKYIIDRR